MKKVYLLLLFCVGYVAGNAQTTVFNFSGSITGYTVPAGVTTLNIIASGAQGGNGQFAGGSGANMSGTFTVTPGHVLNILVGEQPASVTYTGGGGGGSFVWDVTAGNMLLIAAGGGGGSGYDASSSTGIDAVTVNNGTNGGGGFNGGGVGGNGATAPTGTNGNLYAGGGAGWLTNGADGQGSGCTGSATGGATPLNGGAGGVRGGSPGNNGDGGFGGGGGGQAWCLWVGGGGGGGYSGGAGGGYDFGGNAQPGGGGGSYNIGAAQSNSVGNTGNGIVILCAYPAPGTITGTPNVCIGATITLADSGGTPGGTWTSSDITTATVDPSSGMVTGIAAGTVIITYTTPANACGTSTAITTVTVNPIPAITLGLMPVVCAGTTSAAITFSGVTNAISKTATFNFTGGVQTWTVPAGVTSITIDALGAAGGLNSAETRFADRPGYGARVQATLTVTPGQVLNIYAGGLGNNGDSVAGGLGGYNGGGNGAFGFSPFSGGGGGGATDIRIGGVSLTDRVLVAGGGGGAGLECGGNFDRGGDGGGLTGEDGDGACSGGNGGGGTQYAGGLGGVCGCSGSNGIAGTFGIGGDAGVSSSGGGGGGGYYGGGGSQWDGPGGGSSYTDPLLATSVVHTRGYNPGNGQIVISYQVPSTYSLVWSPAAVAAGFADAIDSPISSSPINLVIPFSAPPNTYAGTLTINNNWTSCTSIAYPVNVTINPIPDVAPALSQVVCNSASTTPTIFSGSVSGTTYNWTNSDPSIGLPASGSGDIGSFIAINSTSATVTAVFTVTPIRLGCIGSVQTFSITVYPTPDVVPSLSQTACNGTTTAAINFTGSVAGTSFNWTNSNSSIGLAPSGSGNIAPFTTIDTSTAPVTSVITVNTTANGCTGSSNSFTITIYPTPTLTSLLNPPAICNNTLFNYVPASATDGTTFTWSRATVTGISNLAASGVDTINETLVDTTPHPVVVTYVDTLMANGCVNIQHITVTVNPTPMLSSSLTPHAICDSTLFTYPSTSATAGTTYTWSRAAVIGISNPASTGADTIREILVNTTSNPITVTYVDTLLANGCSNIQYITVAVNPKPRLSTLHTFSPAAVCDSTPVFYVPASATTGTTFIWSRGVIAGLSNPAHSGTDTISEILYDTSANPVNVIYVDTLKANGCMNTERISVIVNPTPRLSSALTPPGICDSQIFNYTPMSNTVGATFAWVRPYVLGISLPAGSGTDNPNEQMVNTTNDNLSVVYVYTITANGCTHTQNVVEVVHPVPTLSSGLSNTVCSGSNFHYMPTGFVYGTTFAWSRPHIAGITPATGSGIGNIDEVLTDSLLLPLATLYTYTLTANGCFHSQIITLAVNPTPPLLQITTHPLSPAFCTNTMYQNFGTSSVPPAGQVYHWTAVNATVWATGAGGQYCLVNFNNPGSAVITLKSNVAGISCITNSSYSATVGATGAVSDKPQVVYFDGQLICLQSDEDSYQWGFDDDVTLDSTILAGEINPNYFITALDMHRLYWVITMRGDCMQKSYYNAPTGITNVNADQTSVKVYPNPANDYINVEISTTVVGNYEVEVLNILGQKLNKTPVTDHKAMIDVKGLPAGYYLVDCYRNGVKIAAQRFIKN